MPTCWDAVNGVSGSRSDRPRVEMSKFSSSFLLLALLRLGAAAEDANCSGAFLSGHANFVLYTEDSVKQGAVLLATPSFRTDAECERACCVDPRCNLALLEPRGTAAENRTCVLFDCVQRNRFVCRFVKQEQYQSYVRLSVFEKYLGTRQRSGESALHLPSLKARDRCSGAR